MSRREPWLIAVKAKWIFQLFRRLFPIGMLLCTGTASTFASTPILSLLLLSCHSLKRLGRSSRPFLAPYLASSVVSIASPKKETQNIRGAVTRKSVFELKRVFNCEIISEVGRFCPHRCEYLVRIPRCTTAQERNSCPMSRL